jgi:hypothetical protein
MATSMRSLPKPRRLAGALALAWLACAAPAGAETKAPPLPELPQLNLKVAEVQVVPAYAPPADRAHVERSVPFAPLVALEAWAKTHVAAVGRRWIAVIVIREASVTATALKPKLDSFRDWFSRQPVERYDGVLELELQIRDDAGKVQARAVTRARHARFLMDNFKDRERERTLELQHLADEIIVVALNQLDREVRGNLGQWLRP